MNRPVLPTLPGRKHLQDDPGPMPAAAVLASALPRGFLTDFGWRASPVDSMLWNVTEDTLTKLQGAGKMLGVLAVHADAERGPAMRFIGAGLLEQAHLLRAAIQAQRDIWKEDEERASKAKPKGKAARRART